MRAFLLCVLALVFSAPAAAAYDVRVIDGDTVNVPAGAVRGLPKRFSVRLIGVNAPESKGKCEKERQLAEAAKLYVRDRLANGKRIKYQFVRWDKYGGRVDGRITIDGKDLAADLVSGGFAVPYSGGKRDPAQWCPTTQKEKRK